MTPLKPRPDDRRRRESGAADWAADWADTRPACFRSEAFAEDLLDLPAHAGRSRTAVGAAPADRAGPTGPADWAARAGRATRPLLGLALVTTLGWLGR